MSVQVEWPSSLPGSSAVDEQQVPAASKQFAFTCYYQ